MKRQPLSKAYLSEDGKGVRPRTGRKRGVASREKGGRISRGVGTWTSRTAGHRRGSVQVGGMFGAD